MASKIFNGLLMLIIALHSIFSQKIIMEGFELQITERCNLRCKDCSILIPYVKNPRHKEIDEILDDLKALLLLVDKNTKFCAELRRSYITPKT